MASGTRAGSAQLGLLWGGVSLALLVLSPFASRLALAAPPCPMKAMTGVPCMTCGGTRAALALTRLELGTALQMNPAVALGMLGLVLGGLVAGALALSGRSIPEPRSFPLWLRIALIAAFAANWIWVIAHGR